jgi:RNA polymerase sigma-70 factor (ECF subfamily)
MDDRAPDRVPDRVLVEKLLARDERAFTEFFDTYAPRLFRFAMRRAGDEDLAEEITQTTLIAAVKKLKTWRGEASLFTWLCTISRRQLVDHWRKAQRQPELRPLDDDPEVRAALESLAVGGGPDVADKLLDSRRLTERVQITLDYLPDRYGDVLEWKYLQGLSVNEIAERLALTPKAVESTLTRARQAFREGFASCQ